MRVIVAAAGTGGHINPGIAIANKIKKEEPDSKIMFIGTSRGLENDLVPRAGYELERIDAYGLSKKITIKNLKNLLKTYKSIGKSKEILKKFKPDIIVGAGGYICGPVCTAAKSLNIPIVIHESNAFPGKAVKMLLKKSDKILVAFEDTKKRLGNSDKVVITGNPTKIKKVNLTNQEKEKIKQEYGLKEDKPLILVFGGSQGAKAINDVIIEIVSKNLNKNYQVIWAAGQGQYDAIKEEFENRDVNIDVKRNVKIVPYIYNMEEVLNTCDLVICRSGAMTITEISIVEKPAIFIPLPNVSNNHQEYNARVLEKVGAAKVILEKDLTAINLNNEIQKIIKDEKVTKQMGENASKIAIKNVEDKIYNEIKELVR